MILATLLLVSNSYAHTQSFSDAIIDINNKHQLPALAGALSVDGKITQIAATGVRKLGSDAKLETGDKFHLGSCTKAMTATLVATFVEEGKIDWTSKLSLLFPELNVHPDLADVTIGELLTHRSGLLKDPENDLYEELSKLETLDARKQLTKIFLEQAPAHKPLTFNYSNIGYTIAGHILERISSKSWETIISERLFSPLGMSSCGFGATSDPIGSLITQPWGHYNNQGTVTAVHFDNSAFYGPAGTVHCSLKDWSKFLTIHIQGFNGIGNLLKPETFVKLHTPYPEAGATYTFGGWNLVQRNWANGPTLTHTGSNVVNYANVWLAPKKNAALFSTSNIGGDPAASATDDVIVELLRNHLAPNRP
jgi:CubicO group peptidase (beta-lactamase class C family)